VCRLYQTRGNDTYKARIQNQSVTSMVRSKLYMKRLVPRKNEALFLIKRDHIENHDGHNAAEGRFATKYLIRDVRAKILAVCGPNCPLCATHESVKKKPAQPIVTSRRGQLVMFDLTKFYVEVHSPRHRMHLYTTTHLFEVTFFLVTSKFGYIWDHRMSCECLIIAKTNREIHSSHDMRSNVRTCFSVLAGLNLVCDTNFEYAI
jgi:hypothetical protein